MERFDVDYGIGLTIAVPLWDFDDPSEYSAAAIAAGDVVYSIDNGANFGTTGLTVASANGFCRVTLSAEAMQAERVLIKGVDQTTPKAFVDFAMELITGNSANSFRGAVKVSTDENGRVDVVALRGVEQAVDNLLTFFTGGQDSPHSKLRMSARGLFPGAVTEDLITSTQVSTDLILETEDVLVGRVVVFTTGPNAGAAVTVSAYNAVTKVLTFTALPDTPLEGDEFVVV
jgi:hypothetical protein